LSNLISTCGVFFELRQTKILGENDFVKDDGINICTHKFACINPETLDLRPRGENGQFSYGCG
jgi:hypothetical protein